MALFNMPEFNYSGKLYVVRRGRKTGIFNTWEECKKQVLNFSGADYKSFTTMEEAKAYLNIPINKEKDYSNWYRVYTDGSNIDNTIYAFGFVILDYNDNIICKAYKGYDTNELSKHRNISGECFGVLEALNYCKNNHINNVLIYHDYLGLKKWAEGDWQTNSPISILYKNRLNDYKNKDNLNFEFVWVKGHNGNRWNEEADRLAKLGLTTFSLTFEENINEIPF
jgi:ribonuclease HI